MTATNDLSEGSAGDAPSDGKLRTATRALRRRRTARTIVHSWRSLTEGGSRTLVACSGGADSTALLLALAGVTRDVVVAHILHDLRPEEQAAADRDFVADLARRLDVPMVEARVRVRDLPGNTEANARRVRYAALARLARDAGCRFVATAHHADDQLESIIMALVRGSGPAGLRGVAPHRRLIPDVWLVRPMLGVTRLETQALCRAVQVAWREDQTNLDTTRFRAALRHGAIAEIGRLAPRGSRHASRTATLMRQAAVLVQRRARRVFSDSASWPRKQCAGEAPVVIGEGLRCAAARLLAGSGADRISARLIDPAVRAIRDKGTDPRRFDWPLGLTLTVTARDVTLSKAS